MRREPVVILLRFVAVLGICFLTWIRVQHSVVHADVASGDPFGSFSGESPDNFWNLQYTHCTDGVIVNVQQLLHTGDTVDPTNGVLSTDNAPYSINLRSVQVNGTDLALTTQASQVRSNLSEAGFTDYNVYKLAGAPGNGGSPVSATVVFQHAPQTVGASGTTAIERWDHGVLGLAPNGQDDDFDAGGVIGDTDASDDTNGDTDTSPGTDTDGDVTDEDGNSGDDPGDGSQHDDAFSFTTQIADCSVLPTTTATVDPAANTNGWNSRNGGSVNVDFSSTDAALSGIDSTQGVKQINVQAQRADGTGTINQTLPGSSGSVTLPSDGTWTVTYDATDTLGNTEAQKTITVLVDSVGPNLNISGPANGTVTSACSGAASRPTFNPADPSLADGSNGSGVASSSDSWSTPTTTSGAGTYTYMATATDNAGNSTSETRTYQVRYPFSGPSSPFSSSTTTANLGSTVPVKFQSLCGTTPLTTVVARLYLEKDSGPVIPAVSSTSGVTGNLFTYTATAGQYIFNLSTKNTPGLTKGTWTLLIKLDDGTTHTATLNLTS